MEEPSPSHAERVESLSRTLDNRKGRAKTIDVEKDDLVACSQRGSNYC